MPEIRQVRIVLITEIKNPVIISEEGIKEYRLPNYCAECVYHRECKGEIQCTKLLNEINEQPYNTKLVNCPIVELPNEVEHLIKISDNRALLRSKEQDEEG